MKFVGSIFFFLFISTSLSAQELFPHNEPASNIPKGVLGIRFANEFYDELGQIRSWQGYKFMFGLTKDLMVTQTFSFSNHHGTHLPADFLSSDGSIGLHTHGTNKGTAYPYLFDTYNLNLKYRFLSDDSQNRHFRMAAWLEAAFGNNAHDEAEPSMMGDNSGLTGGIITTQLIKKWALSFSLSGILPNDYNEKSTGISIQYGNAVNYNFSLGYLIFPFNYKSYKQTNVNLYAEFIGKSYEKANITQNGNSVITDNVPSLEAGNYAELRPSLQFIFNSNFRLDIGPSFKLYGNSYTKFYPALYINFQRYFYFK